MNKQAFKAETSIGKIWVDLENERISPIPGSGIYKGFGELSDSLKKEIQEIAKSRATFLILGKGVAKSALIREAEVAKKKGEAWKSSDYDQILDDMATEYNELENPGQFDSWIVEVEATEEEVELATRFDPSVIRWQRVRPAFSREAFLAIRKELREAGLVDEKCREIDPCYYSRNGSATKERAPGSVALVIRDLAREQGIGAKYPYALSWCANYPRTSRSLEPELETYRIFWELVFQLRKKGVLA